MSNQNTLLEIVQEGVEQLVLEYINSGGSLHTATSKNAGFCVGVRCISSAIADRLEVICQNHMTDSLYWHDLDRDLKQLLTEIRNIK